MLIPKVARLIALCLLVVVGTLIAVAGLHLLQTKRGYTEFLHKLAKREFIAFAPAPINPAWVISGKPTCQAVVFARSHDYRSRSGLWECQGPAKFNFHYEEDESIHILVGSAEIEYLGNKFVLAAGDSTHFVAGTVATWTVPSHVRKTFVFSEPGRLVRTMRRLVK